MSGADIAAIVTAFSLLGVAYIYAGFPILVALASRIRPFRPGKRSNDLTISVVIAAANEEANIGAKIESILSSSVAERIVDVVVVSDGSTDRTPEIVSHYPDGRVRLIQLEKRSGKPTALNVGTDHCQGDILVLTDARQRLERTSIEELIDNFSDERVGVVSGELKFESTDDRTTSAEGVGIYWKYEKFIRKSESRFRSVPGATGAFYAIRRELFRPLPEETILDDVLVPMTAVCAGARCIFESRAIAWDRPTSSPKAEATRKRRTIAGAAQLLVLRPSLILPWKNPIWWEFVSHKLLRLVSPLLLAIALSANVAWLMQSSGVMQIIAGVLLSLQLAGYVGAALGAVLQARGIRSRIPGACLMFWTLNVTTAFALVDALRGDFRVTWTRVAQGSTVVPGDEAEAETNKVADSKSAKEREVSTDSNVAEVESV